MESVFRFRVALLASLLEASNLGSLDGVHNRFSSQDNGLFLACIRTCWGILLIDTYVGNGNAVKAGTSIDPTSFTLHRHKVVDTRTRCLTGHIRGRKTGHGLEMLHAAAI